MHVDVRLEYCYCFFLHDRRNRSRSSGIPNSHGTSRGRSRLGKYLVVGKLAGGVCFGWYDPGSRWDLRCGFLHGGPTYWRTRNSYRAWGANSQCSMAGVGQRSGPGVERSVIGDRGRLRYIEIIDCSYSIIADTRSADRRDNRSWSGCSSAGGLLHPGAARNESRSVGGV